MMSNKSAHFPSFRSSLPSMAGKTIVITGTTSGTGKVAATTVAELGAKVLVLNRASDRSTGSFAELQAACPDAELHAVECDLQSFASVKAAAANVEQLCPEGVHVLCNNAGVVTPHDAWGSLDDWRWVLGVDLWGVIHGVHTFVPRMLAHGQPSHIVNTASVAGIVTFAPIPSYSVAKQGVVAISESLLHTLADQPIGVSVLCPGAVRSGIGTSQRNRPGRGAGEPEPQRTRVWAPETLEPDDIAVQVLEAVHHDRFWILPHEHYVDMHFERAASMRDGTSPPAAATPR